MIDNQTNLRRKKIYSHLVNIIGGKQNVRTFNDAEDKSSIDILSLLDRPGLGLTTYATIGLSDFTIGKTLPSGDELRVEFIGACLSDCMIFDLVMSSCSMNIINDRYSCKPGTVYPDVIASYDNSLSMKHIMFTPLFGWNPIPDVHIPGKTVSWLMMVPLSDGELGYRAAEGYEALSAELERASVDVYDLNRPSIL